MPRYGGVKKATTKKRYDASASRALVTARKALKLAQAQRTETEVKSAEVWLDTIRVDWDGTVVPLTQIDQGTQFNQRVGNFIRIHKFEWKADWYNDVSLPTAVCRMIVFADKEFTVGGPVPIPANVLEIDQSVGVVKVTSPINHDFLQRYKILYDKRVHLSNVGPMCAAADGNKSLGTAGHEIKYQGAPWTSFQQGMIYVLFISDINTATPPAQKPLVNVYGRFSFSDK